MWSWDKDEAKCVKSFLFFVETSKWFKMMLHRQKSSKNLKNMSHKVNPRILTFLSHHGLRGNPGKKKVYLD